MCRYFFKYFIFSQIHTKQAEKNNEHKKLLFTDYRLLITDYQSFNRLIGSSLTFPSPENGRLPWAGKMESLSFAQSTNHSICPQIHTKPIGKINEHK